LGFLRGVCAAIASSTPIEDLVAAFARHLRERQGLASPTIERYTIVARQFLENRFNAGEIDMRAVVATDIIDFIYRQVAHLRPSGLKCVVTAMRSFLRYGQYLGDVAGELVAAVPAVATGATTPELPRAISREHAQRAIDSCDVGTAIGLRDRAILLLLARLGLRANEVITLQLGDCDWERGTFEFEARADASVCCPCPMTWARHCRVS
jgi:site-specific recombinase XerC